MKALIKIILVILLFFASTFLLARLTGIISAEKVTLWLEVAKGIDPLFLFILIILLLISHLFIAIPTLTITILSGYFLGFLLGAITGIIGMLLAGITGYFLSRRFGEKILKKIVPEDNKRREAVQSLQKYGIGMILLCRVSPILPEVSACLAGMTGMKFKKFILVWLLNTIPYAFIASYAGSMSSINNPKPAIFTSLAIYATLWIGWLAYRKYKNSTSTQNQLL